jgi:hypothetical protein
MELGGFAIAERTEPDLGGPSTEQRTLRSEHLALHETNP